MSTSYSIYRFAKPTKYELAGIDFFSEYDSFYLHDSDGEQTVGCIRLFRSTDKEIANIISSKFVRPLVLPEKVTDYGKLYREMGFDENAISEKRVHIKSSKAYGENTNNINAQDVKYLITSIKKQPITTRKIIARQQSLKYFGYYYSDEEFKRESDGLVEIVKQCVIDKYAPACTSN